LKLVPCSQRVERTKAGLDSAVREGRVGGRRSKLSPQQQAEINKDGVQG
jgi:hypothetical protein